MQSKKSYFNKSFFLKDITRFWPVWGLYLLINMIMLPVQLLFYTSDVSGYDTVKEATEHVQQVVEQIVSGSIAPELLMVVALVMAWCVFSYLFTAKSANMVHAFPVCREELFFTHYAAGLLMLWVPQFVTFLLAIAACTVCGYGGISVLFVWLGMSMAISFVFYAFAVLSTMITGHILAVPVFYAVCMCVVSGIKYMMTWLLDNFVYGMTVDIKISSFFSPGVEIIRNVGWESVVIDNLGTTAYRAQGVKELCAYLVVSLVIIGLSLFAYKKRKIEIAGEFTAFRWMRPVFRWGFAFCVSICFSQFIIGLLFWMDFSNVFLKVVCLMLASGLVAFLAAQMILHKKFKIFKRGLFVEWAGYSICVLALMGLIELDVFGYETVVPDASQVESVTTYFNGNITSTDEEIIKDAIEIHQYTVDNKKEIEQELKYDSENYQWASIDYKMKDGSSLSRTYYVPVATVDLNDAGSLASRWIAYENLPENVMNYIFENDGQEMQLLSAQVGYVDVAEDETSYVYQNVMLTGEEAQELFAAVTADIENGRLDQCSLPNAYEQWAEETYYNDITFTYYVGTDTKHVHNGYLQFHTYSKETLDKLLELGILNGDQLVTVERINEIDEAQYGEEYYYEDGVYYEDFVNSY